MSFTYAYVCQMKLYEYKHIHDRNQDFAFSRLLYFYIFK